MARRENLGIYVHIPFCRTRCAYCDFAIVAGAPGRRADEYAAALRREIARFGDVHGRRMVDTVHFGGGTPSLVSPALLARLLDALAAHFEIVPGAEVALEANPEDVSPATSAAWAGAGFDRVAIGVQALVDEAFPALGRDGSAADGRRAVEDAAASPLRSVGADLIFGRPGQEPDAWRRELENVCALPAQHLSLYALETDARTPLVRAFERGTQAAPDPDLAATMYDDAVSALEAAGFARYEISNFAREGHESRHNSKYWTDAPYAGFGMGAASYVDGARWTNPRRYSDYLAVTLGRQAPPAPESYDPDRRAGEALVFGLRRVRGVDLDRIASRHGTEPVRRRLGTLERAAADGLVVRDGTRVRLADRAFLVADELFVDLL